MTIKRIAIVVGDAGIGKTAQMEFIKAKIESLGHIVDVVEADKMPECGRQVETFQIDNHRIEDLMDLKNNNLFREHRGKHRTHKHKYRR